MDAKEFHAAARRIEGLQRKLCETEVERDAWKRSYQDLSKSAHRELTEVRVTARQEIERTREEQRNVWHEQLGARDDESLSDAIKRVLYDREVVTKAERDAQSVLIEEQRRLLAAKQTEIGALEAERDDLRKVVEMVHADLGIQRGDHVGEAISELKKEASDATARQRMTEARALNYSLQAEEARREIERLRAKLASRTVEWPEWAKVGARVRVRSNDCMTTQNSDCVVGEELVISKVDRRDWTIRVGPFGWVHVSDLEPVAEHADSPMPAWATVGQRVSVAAAPQGWESLNGGEFTITKLHSDGSVLGRQNGVEIAIPVTCLTPVAEHVAPPVVSPQVGEVVK